MGCLQGKREKASLHKHFEASTGNPVAHGPLVKMSHIVKLSISEGGGCPRMWTQGAMHKLEATGDNNLPQAPTTCQVQEV